MLPERNDFIVDTSVKILIAMASRSMPFGLGPMSGEVDTSIQLSVELWDKLQVALAAPKPDADTQEEDTPVNSNGDRMVSVTPNTATCTEIGASFVCKRRPTGLSARMVYQLAKNLGISPAGVVKWELADGTVNDAGTYNREQWEKIFYEGVSRGLLNDHPMPAPPKRLRWEE